jgi:ATP-binding cassette, subfamily C, bacterial
MAEAPRKSLFSLLALMIITALTEGVGIMLLVPFLSVAGRTGPPSPGFSIVLEWLGLSHSLGILLCFFVTLIALRALLQYAVLQVRNSFEFGVVDRLRDACFGGLIKVEWRWMAQGRASDFSALLITNIGRVGSGLTFAIELIATSLVALAYLATALILSWQTALVVAIGGAVVIIGFSGARRRVIELGHGFGLANRSMHQQVQEGVSAIRMTKLTGNEEQQSSAFARVVQEVRRQQKAYSKQFSLGQSALQIGGAALLSVVVYIGLELWQMPIPILLPLLVVSMRLVPTLGALQRGWQQWLHAVPALTEIRQLLADLAENAEPDDTAAPQLALTDAIQLNGVFLTYQGRKSAAVNNVTLSIKANQTTAIIGPSGAGKSSLADILTGLIEPDRGDFTVDSVPIKDATRRQWRRSISYVQQDAFLFHSSVRENLSWSNREANEADLKSALTTAAADFVLALPDGLDTVVGDGGVRLSGGERQRIALARALLRSPALLILDEATSALDHANETAIRSAIASLHGRITIILVGHRLAMLDQADQVIELRGGEVVPQSESCVSSKVAELAA